MIRIVATGRDVAMISHCEGTLIIEPCRFISNYKRAANARAIKQRRFNAPVYGAGAADCTPDPSPTPHNDTHPEPPEAA